MPHPAATRFSLPPDLSAAARLLRPFCCLLLAWLLTACDGPPPQADAPPADRSRESLARELVFFNWVDDTDPAVLDAFTREYGVTVTLRTYTATEEAMASLRAGEPCDVVVIENQSVPTLIQEGLLVALDHANIPNLKNIGAAFRELSYDPGNRYAVPYTWGTTGLVVRTDLAQRPVTAWADLWDPHLRGRVGLWLAQRRDVIAVALKSLGYSANSEHPAELEAARNHLAQLTTHALALESVDVNSSATVMASGRLVAAMGYAKDVRAGRRKNPDIRYVLPREGALLWGDNFAVSARSPRQRTAEVFINFLLRADIGARMAASSDYATPNTAALALLDPAVQNDPVVYPDNQALQGAEVLLPLSPEGEKRYADIFNPLFPHRP